MSKKKGIAVAVVLLLILLIGGMLAYFTDTDTKTNVFTIGGNVEISLNEVWTPADGKNVHPGATVDKKPSIKNDSTTTPAFVFMEVIVPCYKSNPTTGTVDTPLFSFTTKAGWAKISESEINLTTQTKKYVYAYGNGTNMTSLSAEATTGTLFDSVSVPNTLTEAQAATVTSPNIVINGYGIQTDNIDDKTPLEIFGLFN